MTILTTVDTRKTWSVEVRGDDAALHRLGAEWDDLVDRCAAATPFQSHAWLASWWRAYGTPGRLRLVLVRLDGRLVAAAALQRRRRLSCDVLTPVGGALSDFVDVLVDDAVAEPATRQLADALASVPGWHVLDFPETRPDAVAGTSLRDVWPGRHHAVPASRCFELPASEMEDLVAALPTHTRKTVRRRINQIRKLGLDVRTVAAEDSDRAVADLLALHAKQWQGRAVNPEHVHDDFAGHLTAAARPMIRDGRAEIVEFRLAGRLVASSLAVIGGGLMGGYLYGAEPELRDRVDILTLLLGETVPSAHRRGCTTFSMLRGTEPYKLRWRPRESANQRVMFSRTGSPRAVAYTGAVRTGRAAIRAAKRHLPWLRSLRDRARRVPAAITVRRKGGSGHG
ncbi:GNAT family N-acetyltransferase [Phytohabitans rumicis]|uniref:Glycosyl transferase family 1 n=1 Tax=Phytohabitans rumicis TaxID=1076125 RepID=A0A6V8KZK8_9ACTN|nr:GNAT family N-acetyltransferase [Phytohabitans rumicis]GFJ87236.1 glycosyl transferase family 1 [Phytohabitans rumicis]